MIERKSIYIIKIYYHINKEYNKGSLIIKKYNNNKVTI